VHRGLKTLRERLASVGVLIPVGGTGMGDIGGLMQRLSSGSGSLDAGRLSGWRPLLKSPRKAAAMKPPAAPATGGLSFMAKAGIAALAVIVGGALCLTMGHARSAENKAPPKPAPPLAVTPAASDSPVKSEPAPRPAGVTGSTPAIAKLVEADTRRRLANPVTIEWSNKPFKDLLAELSKLSGLRITLADDAKDTASRTANLKATDQPVKQLLDLIAKVENLAWRVQDGGVVIGNKAPDAAPADDSGVQMKLARKVTFEFVDTPLDEALGFLKGLADVKFTLTPAAAKAAKAGINLRVTDMELSLAMEWILRLTNLTSRIENGGVTIDIVKPQPAVADIAARLAALKVDAGNRSAADVLTDVVRLPESNVSATTDALILLNKVKLAAGKTDARALLQEVLKDSRLGVAVTDANVVVDVRAVPEWENEIRRKISRHVTFEFVDTSLEEALNFMNQLKRTNFILDPAVAAREKLPTITLKVTDEPLATALEKILKQAKLGADFRSQAIFITKTENLLFPPDLAAPLVEDAAVQKPVAPPADNGAVKPLAPQPEKSEF
jgi:hypothetical protein